MHINPLQNSSILLGPLSERKYFDNAATLENESIPSKNFTLECDIFNDWNYVAFFSYIILLGYMPLEIFNVEMIMPSSSLKTVLSVCFIDTEI